MRRTLDNFQITMVEAVYLCITKKTVSKDMQKEKIKLSNNHSIISTKVKNELTFPTHN